MKDKEEDGVRPVETASGGRMFFELSRSTRWPMELHVDEITNEKCEIKDRPTWGVCDGDVGNGRVFYLSGGVSARGPFRVDAAYPERVRIPADLSGIDEEACDLLYGLVRALRPRHCIETGTHKGRSTLAITSALTKNNQGHLHTVDIFNYVDLRTTLPPMMSARVTQVVGRSPEVFYQDPFVNMKKIDFAFLDGAHDGATLRKELEFVDAHRDSTCYVCVDNSLDSGWPEVRATLNDYCTTKHPIHAVLETMSGMDIVCMRDDLKLATLPGATTQVEARAKVQP